MIRESKLYFGLPDSAAEWLKFDPPRYPILIWYKFAFEDSYLAERYMGTPGPQGNWRGYEAADLTYKIGNLHGKDIFLVHGVGKDLVHYEQSMLLAKALVEENILFRQQVSKN